MIFECRDCGRERRRRSKGELWFVEAVISEQCPECEEREAAAETMGVAMEGS